MQGVTQLARQDVLARQGKRHMQLRWKGCHLAAQQQHLTAHVHGKLQGGGPHTCGCNGANSKAHGGGCEGLQTCDAHEPHKSASQCRMSTTCTKQLGPNTKSGLGQHFCQILGTTLTSRTACCSLTLGRRSNRKHSAQKVHHLACCRCAVRRDLIMYAALTTKLLQQIS